MPGWLLKPHLRFPILLLGITALAYALFGPDDNPITRRSLAYFWDLGHVILGGFAVFLAYLLRPSERNRPPARRLLMALAIGIIFGATTELLQGITGRDASWRDFGFDSLGALLVGLAFLSLEPQRPQRLRWRDRMIVTCVLALLPLPGWLYLQDEQAQATGFPVLARGGSWLEASRFDRAVPIALPDGSGDGERLCLPAQTLWGGAGLNYFPGDWRGYGRLSMHIFLPGPALLPLTLRIDDQAHVRRGQASNDRYNGNLLLQPGWNTIVIPMERILHTPGGRVMDASQIHRLRWFYPGMLSQERCFILSELRLVP